MSQREIDKKAVNALNNKDILEQFLKDNERFIISCAYKTTNKYITKSDDEWSIALEAFMQAIKDYSFEKGSFLSFANLVIHRRLIDFLKKQSRYNPEISVDPYVFSGEPSENEEENTFIKAQVLEKTTIFDNHSIKDEIEAVTQVFLKYGFSFYDLIDCSPKSTKTKSACSLACEFMISNLGVLSEMRLSKNLPLKIIEKNMGVPRKILERHRKYIIAVVEILTNDYPLLAEYLRTFREEHKQ